MLLSLYVVVVCLANPTQGVASALGQYGGAIHPNLYFEHKLGSRDLRNILVAENVPASYCKEGLVEILFWIGAVHDGSENWFQVSGIGAPGESVQYSESGRMCHFETNIALTYQTLDPLLNTLRAVLHVKADPDAPAPVSDVPLQPLHPSMADTISLHRDRTLLWSTASWNIVPDFSTLSQTETFLVFLVESALDNARKNKSKATPMRAGFAGTAFRHFLNNLGSVHGVRYLEVGTYNGTSLFSFVQGNENTIGRAVAIDSWEQKNVPYILRSISAIKDSVIEALRLHKYDKVVTVIAKHCWDVSSNEVIAALGGKANVYFYDAGHTARDHYVAIPHFLSSMESTFILIVDDWSWTSVKRGTYSALTSMPVEIVAELSIDTINSDPDHNPQWHNGVGVFILRKAHLKNLKN